MNTQDRQPLLEVRDLKKYFKSAGGTLKAVDGVSFTIYKGETLGMVGESGCGKTTCGRTAMGVYPKTGGLSLFDGEDVHAMDRAARLKFTSRAQIIYQDPYASLDPRMTVADIIAEGIDIHGLAASRNDRTQRVYELLDQVGLNPEHAHRFAHEFSGGQRQRIGIARALAVNPEFIMCDEPISALDVSIQAQIVNLLIRLQKERGLTYLFIAHDLAMVKHISDRIAVMYLGSLVELTESARLYANPVHPYTQALLSAIPIPDPEVELSRTRIELKGEVSSPIDPPPGCRFAGRCSRACDKCRAETPALREIEPGHFAACHLV